MVYHHQRGLIAPFFQKYYKVIALVIAGLFILSQVVLMLIPAQAAPAVDAFPSTNEANETADRPHVKLASATTNSVDLEFINNTSTQAKFEVRIDGEIVNSGEPHPNPCKASAASLNESCSGLRYIDDDEFYYTAGEVLVDNRASAPIKSNFEARSFNATEKVEVRLARGGERDWDFDWVTFNVLEAPVLSSTLPATGITDQVIDFTTSITETDDTNELVRVKTTLDNPAQASNIELFYLESTGPNAGTYQPLPFNGSGEVFFGPGTGFPVFNATTPLKVTFTAPGTYNSTVEIIRMSDGSTMGEPLHQSIVISNPPVAPAAPTNFFFTKVQNGANTGITCGATINWSIQTTGAGDEFAAWAHWGSAPHTAYHIETFFKDGDTWDRLHNSNNSKPMPYRFYGLGSQGDGLYRIKVVAYDTQNGLNSAAANCNLTYDNTAPTGQAVYSGGTEVDGVRYLETINDLTFDAQLNDNIELDQTSFVVWKVDSDFKNRDHLCGNWTNTSTTAHISGTSASVNGVAVGSTGNCASASWTDGYYEIGHRVYDQAGNFTGFNSPTQKFIIDSAGPSIVITDPASNSFVKSVLVDGEVEDENLKFFNIELSKVGDPSWNFTTQKIFAASGKTLYELTDFDLLGAAYYGLCDGVPCVGWLGGTDLPDGEYKIRINAYDKASNRTIYAHTFTLDTTKPTIAIDPMPPKLLAGTESFAVTVTDDNLDPNDNKQIWVELYKPDDGPDWKNKRGQKVNLSTGSGTFTVDTTYLPDGVYILRVGSVEDAAGNKSGDKSFKFFTVDNTAPEVSGIILNGENVTSPRDYNCGPTDFNLVSGLVDLSATITDNLSGVKNAKYKIRKVTNGGCTQTGIYQSGNVNMSNDSGDSWVTLPGTELDTNDAPADGNYTIMMTVTDNLGNSTTQYVDITVDNTAPVVDVTSHDDGDTIRGTATFEGVVTDDNPHHYWFVLQNSSNQTVAGPGVVNDSNSPANPSFTVNTKTLPDGNYTVKLEARDAADNKDPDIHGPSNDDGVSVDWAEIYIDNTRPVVTIITPNENSYNPTSIVIGATDNHGLKTATAHIYDETNSTLLVPCSTSVTPAGTDAYELTCPVSGLADGVYTIRANAQDLTGYTASTLTRQFTIDTTAPAKVEGLAVFDDDGEVTDGNTNDYSVTTKWDAIADAVKYEYCYWNDIATSPYNEGNCYTSFPTSNQQPGVFNQGEGIHHIKVRAIDAAGNEGPWSDTLDILFDETPPTTVDPLTLPDSNTDWNGAIPIEGVTTDDYGVNFVNIYAKPAGTDDSNYQYITTVDNPDDDSPFNWSTTWDPSTEGPFTADPQGAYDIKATATDVTGNEEHSAFALAVVFDTNPPVVTVNNLTTDDTTPELTGAVDDTNATVEITVNGATYSAVNNGDGTWTLPNDTISPALLVAVYDVQASATDAASNVGTDGTTDELQVVAANNDNNGNVAGTACDVRQEDCSPNTDNDDSGNVLAATGTQIWLGGSLIGLVVAVLAGLSNRINLVTVDARIKNFRTSKQI